ncbi:hypothetical protein ACFQZS_08485 [Mucilaginibacter calamicampi]|uniref:Apea-like HEPN domain-containing protein n=1 Tax=Mucilaginibacter calamicampi TaxID=1302352 RepID=A0ABW2YX67_9SPHI
MSPYFFDFYHNWSNKLLGIIGDDLASVYDRYITSFVIYNSLYNQVPEALIENGIPVASKIFDNKLATEIVVQFVGATNLLDLLYNNGCGNDIQGIINLIDQQMFYIKIKYGQRQRNEDLKLLSDLNSTNHNKKAVAILQVLYHVRCNIFHGNKNFEEYQRILVEPLFKILQIINSELFNRLQ